MSWAESCAKSKSSMASRHSKGTSQSSCCSSISGELMKNSRFSSQQTISFAAPTYSDFPTNALHDPCIVSPLMRSANVSMCQKTSKKTACPKKRSSKTSTSRRSSNLKTMKEENDCDSDYTASGLDPPKISGPLGTCHDVFAKYAPCGHWTTCKKAGCKSKKYFEACQTCSSRSELMNLNLDSCV